uniref:LigA n=1 Tax=Parastrongyloides trichosuri TaxID=131310 RepID=A0A0N4ZVQ8_PARTI
MVRTVGRIAVADDGDAATVDADRRQGAAVADALAEPRLARDAAGLGAGADDGSDPARRGRVFDGVRLHRRGPAHPRQRRGRAADRAEIRDGGRLLRRGAGRPGRARRGLSHQPDARRNGRGHALSAG